MCFLVIIKSSGQWKNPSLPSLKCQVTVKPLYLVFLQLSLELLEITKCRRIGWFQDIFNMWSHYVAPVANSIWFLLLYLFIYLNTYFPALAVIKCWLMCITCWKVVQDDPSVHYRSHCVDILKNVNASAAFKWHKLDLWSSHTDVFCFIDCIVEMKLVGSTFDQIWLFFLRPLFFLPSLMSQWNWTVSWVLEVQKDLLHCVN